MATLDDKVKMMPQNSDNPYPPHIEKYYGKNREWFDYIKAILDHKPVSRIALVKPSKEIGGNIRKVSSVLRGSRPGLIAVTCQMGDCSEEVIGAFVKESLPCLL